MTRLTSFFINLLDAGPGLASSAPSTSPWSLYRPMLQRPSAWELPREASRTQLPAPLPSSSISASSMAALRAPKFFGTPLSDLTVVAGSTRAS